MIHPSLSSHEIRKAINTLKTHLGSAHCGLPEDVFLFISSLTPMVNVDLLIQDASGRTLLTWRHDDFYGPGWHVPGGIVRFKEAVSTRIAAVAAGELGARVTFDPKPLCLHELTNPERDIRGHFISFLYGCRLESALDESRHFDPSAPRNGDWAWHADCPENLIRVHEIYRSWIEGPDSDESRIPTR